MSLPGWYPDPGGTPNRFRYWDGHAWSQNTTDNPATAAPGTSGPSGPDAGGPGRAKDGRRRFGPLILVLAALVVVVLVAVFVVRGLSADPATVAPQPLPSPTVSGWDDSSPTAEPVTPTPVPSESEPTQTQTPTPSQSPEPTEDLPLQPCPEGQPTVRQDHPSDNRVHGGGLSFPRVPGWQDTAGDDFSWAYDVGEQMKLAESPDWYANLAVGALFTGDGFDEPKRAAELVMQCVITSGLYPNFTDRLDTWTKSMTVDGHPAWSIRADIEVDDPHLKTKGDTVEVIVVDTGSPESLSMFIGAADIGDQGLLTTMNSTIEHLRVE